MDDPGPHFFHRDALEFMRAVCRERTLESRQGTAAQLLGALRGNVNKEKPAGDRSGAFAFDKFVGSSVRLILLNHGLGSVLETGI